MTFQDQQLNSMIIQARKMKRLNAVTFQVFQSRTDNTEYLQIEKADQLKAGLNFKP